MQLIKASGMWPTWVKYPLVQYEIRWSMSTDTPATPQMPTTQNGTPRTLILQKRCIPISFSSSFSGSINTRHHCMTMLIEVDVTLYLN